MTYAEMLADLIVVTNRPDLTDDLAVALRRSTLKMHNLEFWKFDLATITLTIGTPAYLMTINTSSALTRFRQIAWIKASDALVTDPVLTSNLGAPLPWYQPADPSRLIDSYGKSINDVYYSIGRTINIRSSSAPNRLYVGYYQKPIVSPVNVYASWIAEEYPYAIIDDAALTVFNTIGLDDKVKKYQITVAEHIQLLKQNYLAEEAR